MLKELALHFPEIDGSDRALPSANLFTAVNDATASPPEAVELVSRNLRLVSPNPVIPLGALMGEADATQNRVIDQLPSEETQT